VKGEQEADSGFSGETFRTSAYTNEDVSVAMKEPREEWEQVWAEWETLSPQLFADLEHLFTERDETTRAFFYDFHKLDTVAVKRLLLRVSFIEEDLKSPGEWMADEVWETVKHIRPCLMDCWISQVRQEIFIPEEESTRIEEQCVLLFKPNSTGVSAPVQAISQYCMMSTMWEKFGLDYFDLQRIPRPLFIRLQKIAHMEIRMQAEEAQRRRAQAKHPKAGRAGGRR